MPLGGWKVLDGLKGPKEDWIFYTVGLTRCLMVDF
jgi:hypothetical protein